MRGKFKAESREKPGGGVGVQAGLQAADQDVERPAAESQGGLQASDWLV